MVFNGPKPQRMQQQLEEREREAPAGYSTDV